MCFKALTSCFESIWLNHTNVKLAVPQDREAGWILQHHPTSPM